MTYKILNSCGVKFESVRLHVFGISDFFMERLLNELTVNLSCWKIDTECFFSQKTTYKNYGFI
jgi:hypothetical protein